MTNLELRGCVLLERKEKMNRTYQSLRDHLPMDNYSVFSGRNILVRCVLTVTALLLQLTFFIGSGQDPNTLSHSVPYMLPAMYK